jgi:hypothetical protein
MRFLIKVTQYVEIKLDETKFTDTYLGEFRRDFYPFDGVEDHAHHLAQLEARGLLNPEFTEGYGPLSDMGITAEIVQTDTETFSC